MSFASRVTYTGDGVTKSFSVPFPYISKSHVNIYVNQSLMLDPMHYSWSGPSTILFITAPGDNDAIEINRWTSPTDALVDFADGSVLRADDLDTAYLHNFYLSQEYTDSYNNAINNILIDMATDRGIVEVETDPIISALVQEMLGDAAAVTLQQRVTDIDSNAEAILTLGEGLQTQINTLAQGIAATVFVQAGEPIPGIDGVPDPIPEGARWYDTDDNNAPYIYQNSAWVNINDPRIGVAAANIAVLTAQMEGAVSAIVEEQFARSNGVETLGQRLSLIGSESGDRQAFIVDLDTTKVSDSESLADRFTALSATDATNAADIVSESITRANDDTAIAADVTALTVRVGDAEGTITTHASAIGTLEGETANIQLEYGVDLTNNGYVSGFRLINGGTPQENAFVILANKFAIVATDGPGETEYVPMQIAGGKVTFNSNVEINGNLILNGSVVGSALVAGTIGATQIGTNAITTDKINANAITAAKIAASQITATHIGVGTVAALGITTGSLSVDGTLTVGTAGKMLSTGAGFETGAGFFLGYDTTQSQSAYKFYVGNKSAGDYLSWDGSELVVRGDLSIGSYTSSTTEVLLAANTLRVTTSETSWEEKKKFKINKPGTVKLYFDGKIASTSGGLISSGQIRSKLDGAVQDTDFFSTTTFASRNHSITTTETSEFITVECKAGSRNPIEPVQSATSIQNCQVRALIDFGESVITD
jgi:hypothetical protein